AWSYLVKWRSLPLEEATWEKGDVLTARPDGPAKIAAFEGRPSLEQRRAPGSLPLGRRPDPSAWKALEESPVYRHDNVLRPYQLEGVNWLVFCRMQRQSSIIADE